MPTIIFQILTLILFLIIIFFLLKKKEEKVDIDELREKISILSKEFSEQLLNLRHQLNQETTQILKNTEDRIFREVDKTVSSIASTDTNIQQKVESLRNQVHQTLSDTVKQLTSNIDGNTMKLTNALDNKLEQLNKRISDTTGLIKDLSLYLGKLNQSTEELRKVNEELKTVLTSPKLQGETGELILENILKEVLPKEIYKIQYWISPNEKVDVAIKIDDRIIPIDSKFPVDSYKKMVNSPSEEYEKNKNEFIKSVKTHIEQVRKYIQPENKTFDFAFMYIPSEPIFYSLLICEDKEGSLFNYAWSQKKVLPVSPQSLFAYLRMVLLGLKGKTIEKNASYILESVEGMGKILENLKNAFDKASKQLRYTGTNFEEAKDYLDKFENEFRNLTRIKIENPVDEKTN